MRVAMYYSNQDIRIQNMPIPQVNSGEILVKVESSSICGSDVIEWYRKEKVPLVLGHEVSGIVREVGQGVTKFKKGDRVIVFHHVPCGECHYCSTGHPTVCDTLRKTHFIPGGFSEYLKLSSIHMNYGIMKIKRSTSFDDATFVEPLACVLRAQKAVQVSPGKTVLVLGSGISGILHIAAAKVFGADAVIATDISDYRLKAAQKFGATKVLHAADNIPNQIRIITNGRLADIVIICAGASSVFDQALQCVDRGATILIFAAAQEGFTLPLPVNEVFWRNEITITSSYAGNPQDCKEALQLIENKKINVADMITHRFSLGNITEGFKLVAEAKESIKVIIKPNKKRLGD